MSELLNELFTVIVSASIASSFFLLLQIFTPIKNRGTRKKELFDASYVQRYFQVVGQYLDGLRNQDNPELSYKAIASDIYRHIPSIYWLEIEEIDKSIAEKDTNKAWDSLKKLSQSLAKNGMDPISSGTSSKNTNSKNTKE